MSRIGAIAAMTRDRIIGRDNQIPWHYSEDFKRFKRVTLGGVIIMGRKTWESIGSHPLPGRRNIVISRSQVCDVEHYASVEAALASCRSDALPIWFIGGAQIYAAALPECNLLDITWVPDRIEPSGAVLFPEIDPRQWRETEPRPLASDSRLILQQYVRI